MENKNNKNSEAKLSGILLFGPPGSGKKTLGKFLSNAGKQYHLTYNELLDSVDKEQLIQDDELIKTLKVHVESLIENNAFSPEDQDLLLVGIPTNVEQATLLSNYIEVRHIIVLDVTDEKELYKRIADANSSLSKSSFKSQLDDYSSKIGEILSFYPKHIISHVNAEQKPLEVLRDVLVRLSHLLSHGPNLHHFEK